MMQKLLPFLGLLLFIGCGGDTNTSNNLSTNPLPQKSSKVPQQTPPQNTPSPLPYITLQKRDLSKIANAPSIGGELGFQNRIEYIQYALNIKGDGVTIGLVDVGNVRTTHQEFQDKNGNSRITNFFDANLSSHATHVAGLMISKGVDPVATGEAPKAHLATVLATKRYANDAITYLLEHNITLSNHSYYVQREAPLKIETFLQEYPYALVIKSAGNKMDNTSEDLSEFASAKSLITVGNIEDDNTLAESSLKGPAQDGSLKPDIVAYGSGMYNAIATSDTSYAAKTGTSMAAPRITGLSALLQEQSLKVRGKPMTSSYLKALLAHNSLDLGIKGPDYTYGYGVPDPLYAFLDIGKEIEKAFRFQLQEEQTVKITGSWLSGEVDLAIKDKSETTRCLPFVLDSKEPAKEATKGINKKDRIEQIICTLPKGEYYLEITGEAKELVLFASLEEKPL